MSKIQIIPVDTKKAMDDYVALPHRLYEGCAEYVPELDMDTRNFFDPKHNDSLKYADVQSFVAYRDGECVGRITGVISHKTNAKWNVRRVRFTNIEFYDSLDISSALLNAVEQWGKEKGMEVIEGPMGITDFDKEGMLVEDFELGGSAAEFWSYPYYIQHMEKLGYTKAVDWLQVRINVPKEIPARYHRVSEYLKEELHLRVIKKTKKDVKAGYGHVLFDMFNEAFAHAKEHCLFHSGKLISILSTIPSCQNPQHDGLYYVYRMKRKDAEQVSQIEVDRFIRNTNILNRQLILLDYCHQCIKHNRQHVPVRMTV